MNCCSEHCGWCGRCDDGLREWPDSDPPQFCDTCGGDVLSAITLAGVGVFCSRDCADAGSLKHEREMSSRQRQAEHGNALKVNA